MGMVYGARRMAYGGASRMMFGQGGPNLPRERLTDEQRTGVVKHWRAKMGWVIPDDYTGLPKGKREEIYLHINDVIGGVAPEQGQQVTFHVYKDKSGLGAEECSFI